MLFTINSLKSKRWVVRKIRKCSSCRKRKWLHTFKTCLIRKLSQRIFLALRLSLITCSTPITCIICILSSTHIKSEMTDKKRWVLLKRKCVCFWCVQLKISLSWRWRYREKKTRCLCHFNDDDCMYRWCCSNYLLRDVYHLLSYPYYKSLITF